MNLRQRILSSLRQEGLTGTVLKVVGIGVERWFDARYGTDTCTRSQLDDLTIDSANKDKGMRYEPTRVMPLIRLFPALRKMMPENSVLVDLGCGKGRVLLLASRWGFLEVRGVEFAQELCDIARKNIAIYKDRTGVRTTFKIIHADVTRYVIDDEENVFFAFNPFDETIFSQVIDNIVLSLRRKPRKILIVNARLTGTFKEILDRQAALAPLQELQYWGWNFSLYSNRD